MTFAEFWSLYPRRVAKIAAEKAWNKANGDEIAEEIIAGLKKQLPAWTDPKFIPHPASWLNAGRWSDDLRVDVRPPVARPVNNYTPPPQTDGWKANLNRVLLALVSEVDGRVDGKTLERLLRGRDYYAAQFREMWGENAPADEFDPIMANVITAFRKVIRGQA